MQNNNRERSLKRIELEALHRAAKRNMYLQITGLVVFVVLVTAVLLFSVTTAWYTNTITAGGLTFKAEAWGFDGEVSVNESAIVVAPGDEGVLELKVTNKSDLASSIGISISKEYMEEVQMQKRIYFYVDKSSVVNGEAVERVYLDNSSGYSYTLYGHNELVLLEDFQTDVPVKWSWVYDVLGYYFIGDVSSATGASSVEVKEYLRPVEYSYDNATYQTDPDDTDGIDESSLLTVDGTKTAAEFLCELTAKDGYAGAYTLAQDGTTLLFNGEPVYTPVPNCYPIDTENNVWVYLCTGAEIENNTAWDTLYAMTPEEEKKSYQVRVSVTGEQLRQNIVTLGATADIAAALNENSGDIVRLESDVTVSQPIAIGKAATDTEPAVRVDALLDLNGSAINLTDTSVTEIFNVAEGSSLTIVNGELSAAEGNKAIAVKTIGGDVTVNNVDISGLKTALRIEDRYSVSGANSTVIVSDSNIDTVDCSIMIYGDGGENPAKTQLIVQDSTVFSHTYAGISGNGNGGINGSGGTNVQVINSTVEGYYTGIYHPQVDGVLSIKNSTVRGMTGLVIKSGKVNIIDSFVEGTADSNSPVVTPNENNVSLSGFLDTGDGIYIESNYGRPIELTVSGQSKIIHNAPISYAVRVYPEAEHVKVNLLGGSYSSDISYLVGEEYYVEAAEVEETVGETVITRTLYTVSKPE